MYAVGIVNIRDPFQNLGKRTESFVTSSDQ